MLRLFLSLAVALCSLAPLTASAETASTLFRELEGALFQVKIIDTPSSNRTGIGSGFAVSENLIATNYHVVSMYLDRPEISRIEVADHQGNDIEVEIVGIDIINDLALLKRTGANPQILSLLSTEPDHGTTAYAMGNPYDLGMSVTEGLYNGIKPGSFPRWIHYAGAVNPGMSGGPAVDAQGSVVGVNVATARNSVGFLVPVAALNALLDKHTGEPVNEAAMQQRIKQQLNETQAQLMDELLAEPWPLEPFGDAMVPAKGADFLSCWGRTNEGEDSGVEVISRGCNSGRQVRVNRSLTSAYIEYEFSHWSSLELNPIQFYNYASRHFGSAYPGNSAGDEDASNYVCHEDTVMAGVADAPRRSRVSYCTRAYLDYPGLYDGFFVGMTIDKDDQILFSHYTLSGFDQTNLALFLERFLESVR